MGNKSLDNKDMLESSESFDEVYRAHSGAIYKFLFWRTKDVQTSEDLTSTTFQKAWASRNSFKGGSQQAWLYRIARNTLFDYWRKNKDLVTEEIETMGMEESISTPEIVEKKLEQERLNAALKRLPKNMKEVVELRFIEGLSSKEAAERLGMEDGNVRIIQYRALKKLRGYLDE